MTGSEGLLLRNGLMGRKKEARRLVTVVHDTCWSPGDNNGSLEKCLQGPICRRKGRVGHHEVAFKLWSK